MKCIDEVPASELKGKRVFLRTSLNLPIAADGSVGDLFRLERALPTLRYLVERGAKVIIVGYLGRKGDTMRPVADALIKMIPDVPVRFFGTDVSHAPAEVAGLRDGECLMLESTRRDSGEESNDPLFTKLLASLADMFVGDAFAEAHRNYASNVGVARLMPAYAGFLMRDEVANLGRARTPTAPSLAILGGAKFETKAPLIQTLLSTYGHLLIAGALANDVFKAQGFDVGHSLISQEAPGDDVLSHPHLIVQRDATIEDASGHAQVKRPQEIGDGDRIVDTGPDSVAQLEPVIATANSILWNGPTGVYEKGYLTYTKQIAEMISHRVQEGASCVIGGGDTIAAIEAAGVSKEHLGFLSTGGGAMLEYLLKGTLPAIEALEL